LSPLLVGTCNAQCASTGRTRALPAGHRGEHAAGKHRFTKLAAVGQTFFAERARLELAAQSNSEGEGSWAPDGVSGSPPAYAELLSTRVLPSATRPSSPGPAEPFRTAVSSPPKEQTMAETGPKCRKCGKHLRITNNKGICSYGRGCRANGAEEPETEVEEAPEVQERRAERTAKLIEAKRRHLAPKAAATSPAKPSKSEETLRRFKLLAEALGFDPDEVLSQLAEQWLTRARAAVKPAAPSGLAGLVTTYDTNGAAPSMPNPSAVIHLGAGPDVRTGEAG
jgi:hypothetical protein